MAAKACWDELAMGRKPTKNLAMPPGMRPRKQRSGRIYYYYGLGGRPRREVPLGADFVEAVRKWSELEKRSQPHPAGVVTFRYVAERYMRDVLVTKAPSTQKIEMFAMAKLLQFFDDPPGPLDQIKPQNIRQYLDWRAKDARERVINLGRKPSGKEGQVRANREKQLFSHIWNKAREWGYTDLTNPCAGVEGFKEIGREDVYIHDDVYAAVYAKAKQPLKDAMDLAYLTGQRPSDVLRMTERSIVDGCLVVQRRKTRVKLRIEVAGELKDLLDRIAARKLAHNPRSIALVVDEGGKQLTLGRLQDHFALARAAAGIAPEDFQFRDLRAKAASDKADAAGLEQAQGQLGHASVTMTEHYVRNRKGKKVAPTR
jgi:integrase